MEKNMDTAVVCGDYMIMFGCYTYRLLVREWIILGLFWDYIYIFPTVLTARQILSRPISPH